MSSRHCRLSPDKCLLWKNKTSNWKRESTYLKKNYINRNFCLNLSLWWIMKWISFINGYLEKVNCQYLPLISFTEHQLKDSKHLLSNNYVWRKVLWFVLFNLRTIEDSVDLWMFKLKQNNMALLLQTPTIVSYFHWMKRSNICQMKRIVIVLL